MRIKSDPLFDNIRDEPEVQQIVRDVEAKYQAEHERVKQWLEKNDMLLSHITIKAPVSYSHIPTFNAQVYSGIAQLEISQI